MHSVALNLRERQFQASAPNQKWAADLTYVWTAEGWLFVAVVLDLYSRRRGLVDAVNHDSATRDGCVVNGNIAP